MTHPIRLRLSRRRGFDLQAASRAANGLPAVNVARPGKWGNPFPVSESVTAEQAVESYRAWLKTRPDMVRAIQRELRGKNVACWCHEGAVCHGDVLLLVAAGEVSV